MLRYASECPVRCPVTIITTGRQADRDGMCHVPAAAASATTRAQQEPSGITHKPSRANYASLLQGSAQSSSVPWHEGALRYVVVPPNARLPPPAQSPRPDPPVQGCCNLRATQCSGCRCSAMGCIGERRRNFLAVQWAAWMSGRIRGYVNMAYKSAVE